MRRALGLMSGTSLDGIDAAILDTDGAAQLRFGPTLIKPYSKRLRERLRRSLGGRQPVKAVERDMTLAHAEVVAELLSAARLEARSIDVIGFHGHTILHRPHERLTWQIGDGALLAARTGIDVVADFRRADVAAGGEGAPLAPVFHAALAANLARPVAVLNIGGVANVTWIGAGGLDSLNRTLIAFDTGPGNALIDDLMLARTGQSCDADGACAARGQVDSRALARLMDHPYFDRPPPKSLDRNAFDPAPVTALETADGAATLTAFTAECVARAMRQFPAPAVAWIVTGGGRRNLTLLAALQRATGQPMLPAEKMGWNGDALEAQAFAYLAVRSLRGLPLSYPRTTGVERAISGGSLFRRG